MKGLIEALQLLLKYANPSFPIQCEHDILYILVNSELVCDKDLERLDELGFFVEGNGFASFRYGSA